MGLLTKKKTKQNRKSTIENIDLEELKKELLEEIKEQNKSAEEKFSEAWHKPKNDNESFKRSMEAYRNQVKEQNEKFSKYIEPNKQNSSSSTPINDQIRKANNKGKLGKEWNFGDEI